MTAKPLNILIADDSATSRTYILKNLKVAEIPLAETYQAANGQEALDILGRSPIDILFLDINMPVMSGLEVVEKMHASGQIQKLPVVIISSDGNAKRMERLQECGVRKILHKPFTPELFSSLIQELFGGGAC